MMLKHVYARERHVRLISSLISFEGGGGGLCPTKLGRNKVLNSNLGQVMRNRTEKFTSHFLRPEIKIYAPKMTGSTVCGKKKK